MPPSQRDEKVSPPTGQDSPNSTHVVASPRTASAKKPSDPSQGNSKSRTIAQAQDGQRTVTYISSSKSGSPKTSPTQLAKHFGRYEIIKPLGEGGMGTVYLARDTQLERHVAIKVPQFVQGIEGEILERFYREARLAATLQHPGICPVYDVGEIEGTHFISMAFIEGRPLDDFIRPDRPMDQRSAAMIIRRIATAVADAHEKGVVHRDLKPANVMINKRKQPVVMDFGLAIQSDNYETRVTKSGTILGSPSYMPPEQLKGERESIGAVSDIYSLGVMFFELIAGRLPYEGATLMLVASQILTEPTPHLSEVRPDVDPRLDAICYKMMAKTISDRYASMKDVVRDLNDFLMNRSGAANANPSAASMEEINREEDEALNEFFHQTILSSPQTVFSKARRKNPSSWFSSTAGRWITAAVCFGVLALAVLLLVKTEKGTLRVEIHDPSISVLIDGEELQIGQTAEKDVALKPGTHSLAVKVGNSQIDLNAQSRLTTDGKQVLVKLGDVTLSGNQFTVVKGENPVLTIRFVETPVTKPDPQTSTAPPVLETPASTASSTAPSLERTKDSVTFAGIKVLHDVPIETLEPGGLVLVGYNSRVFGEVPNAFQGNYYTRCGRYQGITRFEILKGQKVFLALQGDEWGGGGDAEGNWKPEVVSREDLEKAGWKEIAPLPMALKSKDGSLEPWPSWIVFARDCQAGETFAIRNHKYTAPMLIWDKSSPSKEIP